MPTATHRDIIARPHETPKPFAAWEAGVNGESSRPLSIAPSARSVLAEKFDQERRMLLTRAESNALDRMVSSLATRLNTQVKLSHVLRALVGLTLNAEGEIDRRAGEVIGLVRPANGDAKALQRFEKEIAKIIGAALRDAGPLK